MKRNYFISEADWVYVLKEGNSWAYNDLFDRYGKRLLHFSISYLNSVEDAEEIVQNVFLKIWNNRDSLSTKT